MVIWKNDMPYIVRTIDDLNGIIDAEIFEQVKAFIDDYVESNDKVEQLRDMIGDLEDEVSSLEYDISELEDENSELEDTIEKLKEKKNCSQNTKDALNDFIESFDEKVLSKDQYYYWYKLMDAIKEEQEI